MKPNFGSDDKSQRHDDEPVRRYLTTRRKLIAGTAGIAATGLAGCMTDGDGQGTPTDTEAETETESPTGTGTEQPHPDLDILNFALTLEHLEYAFYRDGLKKYSNKAIRNADALSAFGKKVRQEVPTRLAKVRDHEKAHVDTIAGVIKELGGEAVGEAEYTFGHDNPSKFLKTAKALENTGVAAYKGAAPDVKKNNILKSALAVHSVEARHASYLNLVNSSSPFPNAFGKAKSESEVKKAANPFFKADITGGGGMGGGNEPKAERKQPDDTSDIDVLNYALTLEHLENAFYRDGLKKYSDQEIRNAEVLSDFGKEVRSAVPQRLGNIQDHEKAHVDAITSTVNDLGGNPVKEAEYDFGYENPSEFLGVAKALENTGVAAYAGAAPTVKNDDVFKAAAAIHDVEARHASFLNELNGSSPFPEAFDGAKSMDEVKETAGQFIKNS